MTHGIGITVNADQVSFMFGYLLLCDLTTLGSSGRAINPPCGGWYASLSRFEMLPLALDLSRLTGYARARIRVCAHEKKQVLSTLFAGGYECPYEDMECKCRWSGRTPVSFRRIN
jgi:hypothetical protein